MKNTQAHNYHAHDNASDEFTLPTTHNYDIFLEKNDFLGF